MEKIKPHVPILTPQICIFPLYTSAFQHKLTLYQQHLFYDIVQRAAEICHFQANTIKQTRWWVKKTERVQNTGMKYQAWCETLLADTKDTLGLFMELFNDWLKNAQRS